MYKTIIISSVNQITFAHVNPQLNEMLEEKVRPYIQNNDNAVLSQPIILPSQDQKQKVLLFLKLPYQLASSIILNPRQRFI